MRYRQLGRTGAQCSVVGLGTWPLARCQPDVAREVVDAFVERGGNLIDTAHSYGNVEAMLGDVLRDHSREKLVLCTKVSGGSSADNLSEIAIQLFRSLGRLKMDFVDVLFLHNPPDAPETMGLALEELERLRALGVVRHFGVSVGKGDVTGATVQLAKQYMETGRVDVVELAYSVVRQRHAELFPAALDSGVGLIARSCLESGFLCTPSAHTKDYEDHRVRWLGQERRSFGAATKVLDSLCTNAPFDSLTNIALGFAIAPEAVSTAIVGATSREQIIANCAIGSAAPMTGALSGKLTREFGGLTPLFNTSPTTAGSPRNNFLLSEKELAKGARGERSYEDEILDFASNTYMVRVLNGAETGEKKNAALLCVDDEVRFSLDEDPDQWCEFLSLIDGKSTVSELLSRLKTNYKVLEPLIIQAVDYGVLV